MKKILILVFIMMLCILTGCEYNYELPDPNTNLEFWIGENVDEVDFSKYQIKYGMFGGIQYYGTGYKPIINEDGMQIDPEECVLYTVTSYPDYSDEEQHITCIEITDRSIELYDITLNTTLDNFKENMKELGFLVIGESDKYSTVKKDKYSITILFNVKITITVAVENEEGIIF